MLVGDCGAQLPRDQVRHVTLPVTTGYSIVKVTWKEGSLPRKCTEYTSIYCRYEASMETIAPAMIILQLRPILHNTLSYIHAQVVAVLIHR